MSKKCSVCGKKPEVGNNVSHSNRKTKRRFSPNLQSATIDNKKVVVCTGCIKTMCKV